jgi:2-polyprenyl-3-methyl-5-hydroxy-6-metoxy-1,4-benzoquinol methylase
MQPNHEPAIHHPAFDLERLVPDLLSDDPIEHDMVELHRARYAFAARFAAGKRVLDLACGTGYGSDMLAKAGAASVQGVDVSQDAVAYARKRYATPGITYHCLNGMDMKADQPFDMVVSLETLEHIPDVYGFMHHLITLLKPGGMLVASVPTTLSTDVNPHHLHDIGEHEFRSMFFSNGLASIDELVQEQKFSPWRLRQLGKKSIRKYQYRKSLALYYAMHPAMLVRRFWTTLTVGFKNRYLVIAGKKSMCLES